MILALVAFICGVHMGKTFSDLRGADDSLTKIGNHQGQPPPFRLMDRGKETQPAKETRTQSSDSREVKREGGTPRSAPQVLGEKGVRGPKSSTPPPQEEEKTGSSKMKYALQVAAFNNLQEAQDLVSQLKKRGYDAYLVTGSAAAKGTLHRVRVGHFQTLQEARQFALAFEKKENLRPIISSLQSP
jgi:cell division septation protein DedD